MILAMGRLMWKGIRFDARQERDPVPVTTKTEAWWRLKLWPYKHEDWNSGSLHPHTSWAGVVAACNSGPPEAEVITGKLAS